MVCPKAERKRAHATAPTPPPAPGALPSSEYILYKFGQNSTTITNSGSGGDTYNGTAVRAQYATNSVGYPIWGPLDANTDGIRVAGGLDNPYQHTWEVGLNIHQWWPGRGIGPDTYQDGNDGKLLAAGGNQFYMYFHGVSNGPLGGQGGMCSTTGGISNQYNFTVEGTGLSGGSDAVQFWLGVEDAKPVQLDMSGPLSDGARSYWVADYESGIGNLQLNTNYYFQISVDFGGGVDLGTDYAIGNCIDTGSPCSDSCVTGFPGGCYLYVWREYNSVQDLSGGLDWADDVVLWKGGGPGPPTPTPTPGTAPNVNMCVNVREYQPGQE